MLDAPQKLVRETHKPRVAFLGAGPPEIELLADLHAGARVDLVGVYDPDPSATGLGLAQVLGIPAGATPDDRERLRDAEYLVLPHDRAARREIVEWARGLRSDLLSLAEARRRFGAAGPEPVPPPAHVEHESQLQEMVDASARLQAKSELADWLLGLAMRSVHATGGSVQLLAPDTSELFIVAARGLSERLVRLGRHRLGDPVAGVVAATRTPQVLHGLRASGPPTHERGDISAAISVPLEDAGGLVGVLNVSSTAPGHRFGEEQVRVLQRLAPRIAALLRDAQQIEGAANGSWHDLPALLRKLEAERDLLARLTAVCGHLGAALDAAAVQLYLATEEGDWLLLGAAGRKPNEARFVASRSALDTALLEERWVHVSEVGEEAAAVPPQATDALATAVDRVFEERAARRSRLYAPLLGVRPVGVLALEFAALEAAERCSRRAAPLVQQVALYVESQVHERRQEQRLQKLSDLVHALPRLLERRGESLQTGLLAEAVRLAAASCGTLRRVDETNHTYSRPVAHGIPEAALESWKRFDAQLTERTLQTRRAVLTATTERESDRVDERAGQRSLVSVPILHRNRIVAVLNVYDKSARDALDAPVFAAFDRDLLESFAVVAAALLAEPEAGRGGEARPPGPGADDAGTRAPHVPEPVEPPAESAGAAAPAAGREAAHAEAPGVAATPDPDGARNRILQSVQREVARAARYHHGFGISLLRFLGIEALDDASLQRFHDGISHTAQSCVRSSDLLGWYAPDTLVVVAPEVHARNRPMEERLQQRLRAHLTHLVPVGARVDIRIGSGAYPRDGQEARTLIDAAAERAH